MTDLLIARPTTSPATTSPATNRTATTTVATITVAPKTRSVKNLINRAKATPVVLSAVRVVVSFLWICHGLQGLVGAFGGVDGHGTALPPSMVEGYSASVIETVVGALVLIGFGTRICAVLCSGVMAFAYFTVHVEIGPFPITNDGELAVLFCWIFLLIAFLGPGRFSVDTLIRRRRR
ncbi:MAG TPA: DoxX family protein [Pseudonocardiaceae bacterium]|jgi:putative oxidoreductase|nr:DoxX family protein [Pseudonocardiaceae bacterium]